MTAAHLRNRSYRSEAALWRAAAQRTPGKQRPLHNLGHALAEEGRYEEALEAYGRVLGMREDGSVYLPFLHLARGNAFFRLGRLDEAIASWKRALALSPGDPEAMTNIAVALLKLGRREEARGFARAALAAPSPPAEAFAVMGEIALLQGDHRAAASYLSKALGKKPDLLSACRNAALAFEAMGEDGQSWSLVQRCMSAGSAEPPHQELIELERRLRSRTRIQGKTGGRP